MQAALVLALLVLTGAAQSQAQRQFPGIGRAATPAEVTAWDIDVRADFKGLPAGAGSVLKGQSVWEGKCASCHGVFGESNEVFSPLIGGTTAADMQIGRVANLLRSDYPGRTTLMKLPTLSTLWDYINRAMPWTQPKSLSVEEVYAVTAYMLHLGGVVPEDFTLSERNIRDVQARLPNRDGMSTAHALWPGREFGGTGRPDVHGNRCKRDCKAEPKVASFLPDFARNAHGNLAQQNRLVGAQRGADTERAGAQAAQSSAMPATGERASAAATAAPTDLLTRHSCVACHAPDRRVLGPSWAEVAKKRAGQVDYLAGKVREGGVGEWGAVPMPAQSVSQGDARRIAQWLAAGAVR